MFIYLLFLINVLFILIIFNKHMSERVCLFVFLVFIAVVSLTGLSGGICCIQIR